MQRFLALTFGGVIFTLALTHAATGPAATKIDEQIARGEYIATQVAMCVQCHSPRSGTGVLEPNRLFTGTALPYKSPYSALEFAMSAPSLRGLPSGFHQGDVVNLLTTGHDLRGRTPRAPMPPFRMTEDDARAVAAYLASLR